MLWARSAARTIGSPMAARCGLAAAVVLAMVIALAPAAGPSADAASTSTALRVVGNQLVTASGAPADIAGANRSGTEYACVQGWGIFDGPSDATSIAAMAAWGINAVRVPLNEDCWLGINGVPAAYSGTNYQSAIRTYVTALQAHGLAVILDLHWGAPGSQLATAQEQAPDADHAPAFWSSVAAQYKGMSGIAYDLFNEPHDISWACWLNGCTTSAGWQATGMQQLINAVRGAGATQPVIAEGLNWGGDLSGWLANRPSDPAGELTAGWHIYDYSGCNTTSCWDSTVAPVAQQVPVVATEIGETDCAGGFLHTLIPWAQNHGIGYLAWAWDTANCSSAPALISAYTGTPTAYGAAYKSLLAWPAPAAAPAASPTPAASPAPAASPTHAPSPAPAASPTPAPAASSAPVDPAARFDFENGTTQNWAVQWGSTVSVANETGIAASGSHGLALNISGSGYPAAGVRSGLTGVGPGTVVTLRVWAPNGTAPAVQPVLFDSTFTSVALTAQSLASGWNAITFTVPGTINGVNMIGLQINDGSGWTGQLVVDDVTWQPVVFDFEAGTQGWGVAWGSTLAVSESGTAFTGSHGLALAISGAGYPAASESTNVAGLAAGSPITYEVWAPAGVSASISPVVYDANFNVTVLPSQPVSSGWNTLHFTVPQISSVKEIGLQVNDANGWTGQLVLDSVAF